MSEPSNLPKTPDLPSMPALPELPQAPVAPAPLVDTEFEMDDDHIHEQAMKNFQAVSQEINPLVVNHMDEDAVALDDRDGLHDPDEVVMVDDTIDDHVYVRSADEPDDHDFDHDVDDEEEDSYNYTQARQQRRARREKSKNNSKGGKVVTFIASSIIIGIVSFFLKSFLLNDTPDKPDYTPPGAVFGHSSDEQTFETPMELHEYYEAPGTDPPTVEEINAKARQRHNNRLHRDMNEITPVPIERRFRDTPGTPGTPGSSQNPNRPRY